MYQKWAQAHGAHYCTLHIFYALHFNEEVTQKQISESGEMPKQTVNNVIRHLKNENYIMLVENSKDKREKKIVLTEKGEAYSKSLLDPLLKLNENVVEKIGMELIHQLIGELNAYADTLETEMASESELKNETES